jgi:hypothetical protein
VSPLFKNAKARLKNLYETKADISNPVLERNILEGVSQLELDRLVLVGADMKSKIVHGCLIIVAALQDMITPSKIKAGFKDSGQFPLNFNVIMKQSYTKLSNDELEAIFSNTDKDVALFIEKGHLSESDLDNSNIPTNDDRQRDFLPIHNQRAVVITHSNTRNRHFQQQNQGLAIGSALVDCTAKVTKQKLKLAVGLVAKEDKLEKKRSAESDRKAKMSKSELVAEKDAKRVSCELKKASRAEESSHARQLIFQHRV